MGVSFWLFVTLSGPAWGGVPEPALPDGARVLARGGAGRADAMDAAGGGAVLAAASLLPRYELWTGVELGPSWGARVGALDSRTAGYALGAGYAGSTATHDPVPAHLPGWRVPGGTWVDETTRWHDVWVGLAVPFGRGASGGAAATAPDGSPLPGPHRASLALVGRWVRTDSSLAGAASGVTLDASGAWQPVPTLVLAAGADNLLAREGTAGRRASLGVAWRPSLAFGVVADGWAPWGDSAAPDFEQAGGSLGLDAGAVEGGRVLLGGGWDGRPLVSGGAGIRGTSFDLDLGLRLHDPVGARAWTSVTDLRLRF